MKNIEDTIFDEALPVNSLAVLRRLEELLKENNTNNLKVALNKDIRVKKAVWLLLAQGFGAGTSKIDLGEMWDELAEKEEKTKLP